MQQEEQRTTTLDPAERVPAALSDTGCERELNEDRYALIEGPSSSTWIVCDGMGGVAGGELAAQIAIDTMRRNLEQPSLRPAGEALAAAVLDANRVIVLRRQNLQFGNMGTTIVAATFRGPQVVLAFAGDSRAYVARSDSLELLTKDHTYVQELVDRGEMNAQEALEHPQAHVLTRCLGADPGLKVDRRTVYVHPAEHPETLVLCTDGLYSLVTDQEIFGIVRGGSPQRACVELVELARSRGGFDNITVAIIPLEGQLLDHPPENFSEARFLVPKITPEDAKVFSTRDVVQYGLFVGMLCCLAVLGAVMVAAIMASR